MNHFKSILILLCFLLVQILYAQARTQPKAGFEQRIHNAVYAVRLIDTHEHIMSEKEALESTSDFTCLFTNYQLSDLISSGVVPDKIYNTFKGKDVSLEEKWSVIKDAWANVRTTAYGRSVLIGAKDLYGIDDLNEKTYIELSKRIKEAHKQGYYEDILKKKAKIDASIIMEYNTTSPRDVVNEGNCNFRRFFVYDKYCSFFGYNKMRTRLSNYGKDFTSLPELELLIDSVFEQDVKKGIQGAKFGVAYYRTLKFDDVPRETANAVFEKMKADPDHLFLFEEAKPLQDFMFFKLLSLCDKYKLPVQIHTGLQTGSGNDISNANPVGLVKAFFKFPNLKFCLLHAGYPYGGEMATLAKNFPNVYIDMAWSALISQSFTVRYLQEFIETVPNNKIMAYGGDSQTVEGAYGASVLARETVEKALTGMVKDGYLTEAEALDVAKKILRENAISIYNLKF
ncbi:MAG: amidohydrolase family protein [Bacteroidota bacterium]|nr:amidohydrolase family protein [Bacteroidota bacterium]